MIAWYQIISYSIINGIRIFACLFIASILLKLERPTRSTMWLSLICGGLTTVLIVSPLSKIGAIAVEMIAILSVLYWKGHCKPWKAVASVGCFEIAVALWDYLFSIGINSFFKYSTLDNLIRQYMVPIWSVRLLMVALIVHIGKQGDRANKTIRRGSSIIAVMGAFCILVLAGQSQVDLPDGQITTWAILSGVLLVATLFYRVHYQYEVEKELTQLKTEQAKILERDYQNLNQVYSANAKLYHDLHNHLDVLYSYIAQGKSESALDYLNNLRTPIEKIVRSTWTGDEAIDYLIGSKLSAAEQSGVEVSTNIEFPRHTNIKSSDFTAILGNLLDNALEAVANLGEGPRFLHLTIRRINDMLIIKVENSCSLELHIYGTEIETSKEDATLHGWGLKSARATTEQYDGTLELSCKNGVFCAVAMLCFEAI